MATTSQSLSQAAPLSTRTAARRFQDMLKEEGRLLVGPGVFDGLSAHLATNYGFDFLYLAGSGTSVSRVGQPDLSVLTQSEMADVARVVCACSTVPVIADIDTGFGGPINIRRFGGPINIRRTIQLMEHAGVAGVHIEDQTFPKRCGQLKGKTVDSLEVFLERVRAAVEAKTDPDFVIIARTDARQAPNAGFEEGVKRLKAAMEAGADMAFMESPMSVEECRRLVQELHPHPVLINVLPHGLTPDLTVDQCRSLGFKAAIYPCTGFLPAMLAMDKAYSELKHKGTDLGACEGHNIEDVFEKVGLKDAFGWDKKVAEFSQCEVDKIVKGQTN